VLASDNAPLVQHPYLRAVSTELARSYGLTLKTRVFFRDVNFAVYELDSVDDVSQLDAMMRRVLNENRGLVREVCYDYFVYPVSILHGSGRTGAVAPRQLTPEEVRRVLGGDRSGYKSVAGSPVRTTSTPPDDPMHLNRSGTGGGTWANWRIGAVDGEAWDKSTGSTDVLVAVIDTGIRMTHEDLDDNVITPATTAPFNAPGD
jgi:hypothetical protein